MKSQFQKTYLKESSHLPIFSWNSTYKERKVGRKKFWKQNILHFIRMWHTCSFISLNPREKPARPRTSYSTAKYQEAVFRLPENSIAIVWSGFSLVMI